MITTTYINDFSGLAELLFKQERNKDNGRYRSSFFYRGMPNESFDLKTSLERNCGDKAKELEMHLLENFIKYVSIEDPTINESIWNAMIVGQHHGLPTRLLDWTHSPLVALHFAMTEGKLSDLSSHDCVVWKIDAREINEKLPPKYKTALEQKKTFIFSLKLLSGITNSLEEYDNDMKDQALITIEPPSIDQRIVNQYSFFTLHPTGISDFVEFLNDNTQHTEKYVIDRKMRWDLRDVLDQLNMNERTIYPGIDGIAKWLARHYYVKG